MLTFIHVFFNFVWRTLLYTYLCSLAFTADCYINYIIVICGASYFVSRRYSTEQSIMHKPTITPIQGSRDPFLHFGAIPSERVKVSISNFGMQLDRKQCYTIRMSKFRSTGVY